MVWHRVTSTLAVGDAALSAPWRHPAGWLSKTSLAHHAQCGIEFERPFGSRHFTQAKCTCREMEFLFDTADVDFLTSAVRRALYPICVLPWVSTLGSQTESDGNPRQPESVVRLKVLPRSFDVVACTGTGLSGR